VDLALLQALNGLSYAAVLYLVAVGLSLTYGVGRFLNLAHGGFYLLGTYLALALVRRIGFFGALVVAPLLVMALALVIERLLLRRYAGEHRAIEQMLLTFGLAFVLSDLMRVLFGGRIRSLPAPRLLAGRIDLGIASFPVYRLAVIVVGLVVAAAIALVLRRTRAGVTIRAAAADQAVASSLGIDTARVLSATYAAGAGLAAFGGVIGAPIVATATGLDFTTLILALVVVVIGGLGSVTATFFSAILVGLFDSFGRVLLPRYAVFALFLLLAVVLVVRPQGLFVRRAA
jgi:branched-chain amino acid transport system permease protein